MRNWSDLNQELLVEILKKIRFHEDYVTFCRVCSSWRFAAKNNFIFGYKSFQIPWLMLAPEKCSYDRSFFSIWKDQNRKVYIPEAKGKKCFSSKGWLITVGQDWGISLLHPFSRVEIKLPHIKTFFHWYHCMTRTTVYVGFIGKCALSSSPSITSDYILMVLYGDTRKLAYFRPGNKVWNTINIYGRELHTMYDDVIYYNNKFYAVNGRGEIIVCDFSGEEVVGHPVAQVPLDLVEIYNDDMEKLEKLYLVECGEALLVVSREGVYMRRVGKRYIQSTFAFQIFQVDLRTNTWTVVKDLGNRALFLGYNSSMSIEASEFSGCKPNCIYFTDDCHTVNWFRRDGGKDMGVYNIQEGTIVPHFKGKSYNRINPPIWIEQSFD